MPKGFDDCIKNGGKVKTKNLKNNKYIRICYDKKGNSHAGEVTTKKKSSKPKSKADRQREQLEDAKRLADSLQHLREHFNTKYHAHT